MAGYGRVGVSAVRPVGNIQETHQYDVDVRFDIGFDWGGYNYNPAPYRITCDGQTQSGSQAFSIPSGGGNVVWGNIGGTKTFRITMPNSGQNKTIQLSATINTEVNPSVINASGSYTLSAVTWSYTVKYDANGGSNTPASQTKQHGKNLVLSSTVPIKNGYIFLGWSTSRDSNTVSYSPGSTYTSNSNITLYAVWSKVNPVKFSITPKNITIPSTSGGEANVPLVSLAYVPVTTSQNYTTNFYYKVCYVDSINGDVIDLNTNSLNKTIGPLNHKDISHGAGGSDGTLISIASDIVKKSIQNCKSDTEVKFLVAVSTGDNKFSNDSTWKTIVTCKLIDFNVLRCTDIEAKRDSNNDVIANIQLKYPKSYTQATTFPKLKMEISSTSSFLPIQIIKDGTDNLVTYTVTIPSSYLPTTSGTINLYTSDKLFDVKLQFRHSSTASDGDSIYIYPNGNCEAIEFIEHDTKFGFEAGGKVYCKEFIETNEGIILDMNNKKMIFSQLIEV